MRSARRTLFAMSYTLAMSRRALVAARRERSAEAVRRTAVEWADTLCERLGVRVRAEGIDAVDWDRPLVVMSNHQSLIDVPVIVSGLGRAFGFLAKKELFRVPFFGRAMTGLGCVCIDRGDATSAHRSIAAAGAQVRAGSSIIVFPEGTRGPGGRLLPLKKGPFYLVQAASVPIVPLGLSGTGRVLSRNGLLIYPGEVRLRVGAPLACAGDSAEAREELRARTREALLALAGLGEG
ncbi:MAG: 1-acyl-sn-glycerol-3-phosphate acyltransferase [Deltaproteobacteria bacterium]|nr:1-acyl-sn-glycerol-3-phosphate acyltransferase [Deltaproteobacteria bacterium]